MFISRNYLSDRASTVRRLSGGLTSQASVLILAALALVVLAGILSFTNQTDTHRLEVGANQVESLLRNARKYAAARSGQVRLVLAEQPSKAVILLEADPIKQPGILLPHIPQHPYNFNVDDGLVRIDRCKRIAPQTGAAPITGPAPLSRSGRPIEAITFHSDGSHDSAVIELVSTDQGDRRTILIELDGVKMQVSVRIMTPEKMEEYRNAEKTRR